VESFLSLFAGGGACLDDFHLLRQDVALQKLGLKVSSPEAARFFLKAFHEEEGLEGRVPHQAFIPEETELLEGLAEVTRDLMGKATRQQAPWKATIDMDALVIESDKREAEYTYLGGRGCWRFCRRRLWPCRHRLVCFAFVPMRRAMCMSFWRGVGKRSRGGRGWSLPSART